MFTLVKITSKKISLKEEENQGAVHYVIEKFVLWRLQNWKNNPRVNALIWKAILSVFSMTVIGAVIAVSLYVAFNLLGQKKTFELGKIIEELSKVYLKSWAKLGLVLTGSITVAYWNMSTMFNKKWSYCADLYNKILSVPKSDLEQRELLRNALAIDILTLDLWAHRSFSALFAVELLKAIDCAHSEAHALSERTRAESGNFTESDALRVLEARNHQLVGAINSKSENPTLSSAIKINS
ncbi:MAG: hypothetical protein JNM39_07415 [Bdellovibrionaceae bacterium]|nr:hypothetical protein [Pseudobdellovibrionaceae bacterium]